MGSVMAPEKRTRVNYIPATSVAVYNKDIIIILSFWTKLENFS